MKKGWKKPDCDICRSDKYLSFLWRDVTTWEHPGKFNFVKCRRCGLVFQSPRAPFEQAVNYYPLESYWGRDIRKVRKTKGWLKERAYMFDFLYKGIFSRKKRGAILDIGSGLGLFLSKFKEKGWEVLGTDISQDVAKYSKKAFGVKVLVGDVVKLDLPKKHFDVVTMNGVFEHVYTPRKTLTKIRQLLKDEGILVIVVPNIESLGSLIYGKGWYHLQPGRHIYQFSPKTLSQLLEETSFSIEKISHSYWAHNYYSLFENFRFRVSPRFKKATTGGLVEGNVKDLAKSSKFSLIKEFGKIVGRTLAFIGSVIEPIIGRGEVITVYAKKT